MQTAEQQSVKTACWSCGSERAAGLPFCDACGKVQPPDPGLTYFDVFGLPWKLGLDPSALERAFYKLSRKLHPDVYAQASAQEQQWSLEQTSLLNDAYRTLKDPVTRTEYLLRLEGVEMQQERARESEAKKEPRIPPDLLEEVFELNLQLEEMRMNQKMGEDDPQLRGDLERARTLFEGQLADADRQLRTLWSEWDAALDAQDRPAQTEAKNRMASLLDRRRYVRNLVRDVNETLGT
ncbi:Fe-S protein assembly co-chaperone HscB [Pseudacidobacterium ailaaui]|uniref:Fe-S protein assembly co-chaperone HscB n=1 Tax=Pseudacidobacterium ailaaui TaxID=1382359 RepID=UPI0009DCC1A6|nr:Fe-S protein assembly co-chaperone HscB [Pseudacidobacterium ailaaui]